MSEILTYAVRLAHTAANGIGIQEEVTHSLDTNPPEGIVMIDIERDDGDICLTPWDVQSRRIHDADGIWPTLYGGEGGGKGYAMQDGEKYVIRRLMPVETERLQGFPDQHTNLEGCDVDAVTEKVAASLGYDEEQTAALRRKVSRWSKSTPDSPRYKATGNSMAVPCMRWIGERIQMVEDMCKEGGGTSDGR